VSSPRELATKFTDEKQYFVCEATVYRLLKAQDLIASPAYIVIKARDEFHKDDPAQRDVADRFYLFQADRLGLGLPLDRARRLFPLHHLVEICTTMTAGDVTDTLDLALAASGCDSATVLHMPRLLSDNGPSYVAGELAAYIEAQSMSHVRGAPFHPQTQGKIERWHQTLKNRILLENYYLPGDLEAQIDLHRAL
jgi:transposase InsO family protein